MSLTTTHVASYAMSSGGKMSVFSVDFDSSYPTGGETWDISDYFSGSPTVLCGASDDGYMISHNGGTAAAGKLVCFTAASTEAGSAANLTSVVDVVIIVVGTDA